MPGWPTPQGSIFWYNQRWYDYIGLGEDQIERWGWTSVQHPDHVGRTMERLEQAWSAGEFWEDTFPLLGKDGKFKWFIARAVPLRDSQGSVARWFGTCTDISDQIAAEEKIRHLNSQLQQRLAELEAIMQVLPVGVAVSHDPSGDFITGNAALNQMLGAQVGENISLNHAESNPLSFRFYQDDRELAPQELPLQRSAASGQQLGTMELEIRHNGGSPVYLLASASPLRDPAGAVRGAVGAFFDVTGRKRLEDLLRERADLLELATEAIIVRDLNGLLLFWNSGAEALYGWQRDEVLGKPHPRDSADPVSGGDAAIESTLASVRQLGGKPHPDHSRWPGTGRGQPACAQGAGDAVLEINRDITSQLQAEDALRKAERLAAMGRVAGIIAHEINNPLEAISNTFFLLRDHPSLDEEARHYAQMGEEEMLRLSHITRQTLGFYRESKHPVDVSIAQLLDDILELQLRRMEFNKIAVEKRYRSQGMVQGFPVELKQVFLNLIGNAMQAMPDGGRLRLHVFESSAPRRSAGGHLGLRLRHRRRHRCRTRQAPLRTLLHHQVRKGHRDLDCGSARASFKSTEEASPSGASAGRVRNITCFQIFLPHADLGAADRIDGPPESLKVAEPAARASGRG